jgi:hypothetical protein
MWTTRINDLAHEDGRELEDVFEMWSERAALREYDGGMSRGDAEHAAFIDVKTMLASSRRGPRSVGSRAVEADANAKTRLPWVSPSS